MLVGAVGIGLKATLKIRKLLILLNAKNAKNTGFAQARYTPGTRTSALKSVMSCLSHSETIASCAQGAQVSFASLDRGLEITPLPCSRILKTRSNISQERALTLAERTVRTARRRRLLTRRAVAKQYVIICESKSRQIRRRQVVHLNPESDASET